MTHTITTFLPATAAAYAGSRVPGTSNCALEAAARLAQTDQELEDRAAPLCVRLDREPWIDRVLEKRGPPGHSAPAPQAVFQARGIVWLGREAVGLVEERRVACQGVSHRRGRIDPPLDGGADAVPG